MNLDLLFGLILLKAKLNCQVASCSVTINLNFNWMLYLLQCLKQGLFIWSAISLEKQNSLLIKTRDLKISNGFGGHCDLCMLSELYFGIELYEIALSWCLWWTSLSICFLVFTKMSHLVIKEIPSLLEF